MGVKTSLWRETGVGMNLRAVGLCYLERGCSRGMAPSNMRGPWTYPGVSRGMSCEDPNLYPLLHYVAGPECKMPACSTLSLTRLAMKFHPRQIGPD